MADTRVQVCTDMLGSSVVEAPCQEMAPAHWAAALLTLMRRIIKRKMRRQKGRGGGGPQRSKQKAWDAEKKGAE